MPQNPSTDELDRSDVAQAVEGHGDAYARLVRRHQPGIARQMWRFTRDPRAHAELVQDVFVNAYTSLRGFRGTGPFEHWLRKIAMRTGLALWRTRPRERALPDDPAARPADDPAGCTPSEAAELVNRALVLLPPRDRLVITLLHLEERSVVEVAQATGWSTALVKVQAWRARAKLRKVLQEQGWGGE